MKIILIDAVHALIIKGHGLNQELISLLDRYDEPKLIVTNANNDEIREYGIDQAPYNIFTLQHNPNKTDPEYFSKLLQTKG